MVTVSLNQGQYLERALRSVLEQDYPVEYTLVDPGSTDGSRALIDAYRRYLSRVIVEPDDGPADGLNKALRLSTGEIFICINADDAMLPGAVKSAVEAFQRYPLAAVVYASGYMVDAGGQPIRRFFSTDFDPRSFVLGGANVMQQSTFIRREAFLDVGGFNPQNRTSWDGELLIDLALAGYSLRRVAGLWSLFRIHPSSISGSSRLSSEYDRDRLRLFEKVVGRPPRKRDCLAFMAARAQKWARNPRYLEWRIADTLRRPRILQEP